MLKSRILHTSELKDHSDLSVYGVFNTTTIHWEYFVISHNGAKLSGELCLYTQDISVKAVSEYGRKFNNKEEGIQFILEYKDKWEYATNDTRQEKRDQKIDDILDNE